MQAPAGRPASMRERDGAGKMASLWRSKWFRERA